VLICLNGCGGAVAASLLVGQRVITGRGGDTCGGQHTAQRTSGVVARAR
jgi:hypothetical protein